MNTRLKVVLLVVLLLAIGLTGYYELQDSGGNGSKKSDVAAVPDTTTASTDSAQTSTGNAAPAEPDLEASSKGYSEQIAAWSGHSKASTVSSAADSTALSPVLVKALNNVISGTKGEERLSSFVSQYSGKDLEHNRQLIALLIDDKQPELAFELATLVWQSNPAAEEAKALYAEVYKLYTTKVMNKQEEIISGGAQ